MARSLKRFQRSKTLDQKSSIEYENSCSDTKIDKVDLLLDDWRQNPDEALRNENYLHKRRNAISRPLTLEETGELKRFLILLSLVDTIELEFPYCNTTIKV